jgi:hypothetical protein
MRTIHDIVQRIRAEFLEMPGLQLKAVQVQRLCGVEHIVCESVLQSLVTEGFLRLKSDGHYARLTEGPTPRPLAAEAILGTTNDFLKAS